MCRRGVTIRIMTPQLVGDIKAGVCGVPTVRLSESGNFYYAKVVTFGSFWRFLLLKPLGCKTLRLKFALPPSYRIGLMG